MKERLEIRHICYIMCPEASAGMLEGVLAEPGGAQRTRAVLGGREWRWRWLGTWQVVLVPAGGPCDD